MLLGERRVHPAPLFRAHRVQLAGQSPSVRPSLHHEAAVSTPRTVVREAEEGKRLGSPVTARLALFGGVFPEFQQARLVVVEHQAKRGEARPKVD